MNHSIKILVFSLNMFYLIYMLCLTRYSFSPFFDISHQLGSDDLLLFILNERFLVYLITLNDLIFILDTFTQFVFYFIV